MLPPLPRCSGWVPSSLIHPTVSAFPGMAAGSACTSSFSRFARRSLALRPAHSRRSPIRDPLSEGFSHFVSSMTAPVASGWSVFAGWELHPLESAALSRRTPRTIEPGAYCAGLAIAWQRSRSDAEYYNDKAGAFSVGFLEPRVPLRDEPFAALDALAQRAQNRNRLRRIFLNGLGLCRGPFRAAIRATPARRDALGSLHQTGHRHRGRRSPHAFW